MDEPAETAPEAPPPKMTAGQAHAKIAELGRYLRATREERIAAARAALDELLERHGVALHIELIPVEELSGRPRR